MGDVDIYCIGKTEDFDFTTFAANVVHPLALSIGSVADMANQVVLACKSAAAKLAELTIVGHGDPLGQYIGGDWVDKGSLGSFRTGLVRLQPLFGRDGLVTLGGCEQGQNGAFLLALSDMLNVPVRGFTAYQRALWPGNQGSETRCYLTCTRGQRDAWDDYIDPGIKRVRRAFSGGD
jgi:hypothetical protein